MEFFGARLKQYWKLLKNREFFKIYKNRELNEFFWYVCIPGGILRTRKANGTLKKLWLTFHILSVATIFFINTYCFLNIEEKNLRTILTLFRPISMVLSNAFASLVFCYFYEYMETYLNEMEEYLNTLPNHENERYSRGFTYFEIFSLMFICVGSWTKGFWFYFPMLEEYASKSNIINSLSSVALIFAALPIIILIYCGQKMKQIFLSKLVFAYHDSQQQMSNLAKSTMENLETSHNEELSIEQKDPQRWNKTAHLFVKRRNTICKSFDKNIAYFAKLHGKMVKIHLLMKNFFELVCTVIVFRYMILLVLLGKDVAKTLRDPSEMSFGTLTKLIIILILVNNLNGYCLLGATLNNMMEDIAFEAYSLPWYMFPSESRKMVSLLMIQFQIPQRLRVFSTFPLDVTLVPAVLNLAYSYVSVLQVILESPK